MVQPVGLTVELPSTTHSPTPARTWTGRTPGLYSAYPRTYGGDSRDGTLLDCIISLLHHFRTPQGNPSLDHPQYHGVRPVSHPVLHHWPSISLHNARSHRLSPNLSHYPYTLPYPTFSPPTLFSHASLSLLYMTQLIHYFHQGNIIFFMLSSSL